MRPGLRFCQCCTQYVAVTQIFEMPVCNTCFMKLKRVERQLDERQSAHEEYERWQLEYYWNHSEDTHVGWRP